MLSLNRFRIISYAPGHITGIFSIYDEYDNPLQRGSRGVGFSIDRGAVVRILGIRSNRVTIKARYNGKPAKTTEIAVKQFLENHDLKYRLEIQIKPSLPVSQGFGISAAGTLAALYGLTKLFRVEEGEALKYTHVAEVRLGTGLGDAVAEWYGGFEVRVLPGIPPMGLVERIRVPKNTKVVLAVVDEPIKTKGVIKNPEFKERINRVGDDLLEEFLDSDQSLEEFISLSYEFAQEVGIMSKRTSLTLRNLWKEGISASQCMIGNSIFTFDESAIEILKEMGIKDIYTSYIGKGPRIIKIERV
ncbi:MAG: hypothetical protein DRN30_05190 [Thermoplasmata archaeon]|nr:MAG: hypothetical protein DRN30_05190 [Thermoplasmata archaeon]